MGERPILVTGAAGGVGGVARTVVALLREAGVPVRAMAHHDDDRTTLLRALGAQVVVGDLTQPSDVVRALDGCGRMFLTMSVSPSFLEASVVATVARDLDGLEAARRMDRAGRAAGGASSAHRSAPRHDGTAPPTEPVRPLHEHR